MARTLRRKQYQPNWVTEDLYGFTDPRTGVYCWAGHIQLEGPERAKKLRQWHSVKRHPVCSGGGPGKSFRHQKENRFRTYCKAEVFRWFRQPNHEIQISPKQRMDYWD